MRRVRGQQRLARLHPSSLGSQGRLRGRGHRPTRLRRRPKRPRPEGLLKNSSAQASKDENRPKKKM